MQRELTLGVLLLWPLSLLPAQVLPAGGSLDPSRDVSVVKTVGETHAPLPEEYIWTANDAAVITEEKNLSQLKSNTWKVEPHYFRRSFDLAKAPEHATIYVAGPRDAEIFLNGKPVYSMKSSGGVHSAFRAMHSVDVHDALRAGKNVLAVRAVRGYGSHHHTNGLKTHWLNSGEVLAVKIVPAVAGVDVKPLVVSDGAWRSSLKADAEWASAAFDDSGWPRVQSLGSIEGDGDFFQWNADAGMYAWPGYVGESAYMAMYRLKAATRKDGAASIDLDFGRELAGRVVLLNGAGKPVTVRVQCGESLGELEKAPYLGKNEVDVPAKGEARGPKTAFRYARVVFDAAVPDAVKLAVYAEGIYYPVTYAGSFESSDARLNRIWEVSAYTAHLVMQDSIWDGAKRDRGRWIGDQEVIDRVVGDVFGDERLVRDALAQTIGPAPVTDHVNGLPGYSAWWLVAEAEYLRRWGNLTAVRAVQPQILQLLPRMDAELDARGVYVAASGRKPFVDWAKEYSADSAETRRAVHFEYIYAYREAAWLLRQLGDEADAAKWSQRADAMTAAAAKYLATDATYGDRWQANAVAVLAGATTPEQKAAIWKSVLARTVDGRKPGDVITPYYGDYVLNAMAALNKRQEALAWMRSYWGGMLDAGATSFWEAWDPAWAGADPHAKLEADDKVGYNASLAHGWAGGPAAWLMEEVLGITSTAPGFARVQIRPELAGLQWAKGGVPTPHGLVRVDASAERVIVEIPKGVVADVLLPAGVWMQRGTTAKAEPVENGARQRVTLRAAGKFEFEVER